MKKYLSLLLIAAMLLSLAACGAKPAQTATEAPTEAPTAAPTEVPTEMPTEAPAEDAEVHLGALTGPTVMGMVKLLHDAELGQSIGTYTSLLAGSADELTPQILQGNLDIVSVPANLASVLFHKTEGGVQALAVNVLGVLYINEFNTEDVHTVADLHGKTIFATGKGSVPEYFLRYILTENGLDPDADVTIEWKSEPSEVVATLNAQQSGIAMLPQPYVTAAAAQLGEGFHTVLSLSDEWAALDNGSLCTTAVIMARTAFAQEHPEAVELFLSEFAASAAWVNENVPEAAEYCGALGFIKAPVAQKAIPSCNIVCITGQEMYTALSGCLGVLYQQEPKAVGGSLPGLDFYYGCE